MAAVRAGNVYALGYARFRDAEFTGTYYTTTQYTPSALEVIRAKFASYVTACGHDVGPGSVKWTTRELEAGATPGEREFDWHHTVPGPWGPRVLAVDVAVRVLAPVRSYPRCGDWLCHVDVDWADVDPVGEPAVYAGVAAEQALVEQLLGTSSALVMHDLIGEALAGRRRQAEGMPLWTTDIRPPAPARM